jgi:hypothetical protein
LGYFLCIDSNLDIGTVVANIANPFSSIILLYEIEDEGGENLLSYLSRIACPTKIKIHSTATKQMNIRKAILSAK